MKKRLGNLLGRSRNDQRSRTNRLRNLQMESLEGRRLLASDLGLSHHNFLIAEDVNQDFRVTPLDALLVVNEINRSGARSFAEGETAGQLTHFVDVNGDNLLSAVDALRVINRLNGEGEGGALIAYSYTVTDTSGGTLSNVAVGDTFRVNVFVEDARDLTQVVVPPGQSLNQVAGVYSAAHDLGISDPSLATYQIATDFFSGVTFGSEFLNDQGANEGGGLQIGGTTSPDILDGQTFSLTKGATTITFEFDTNGTATGGTTVISLRNPNASTPPDPLTFAEVATGMVAAINGSSLGVTATSNGQGVVGLPMDQVTLDAGTTTLTPSTIQQEYFNEVKSFLDRSRSPDPAATLHFYSVDFVAQSPGTLTFNPNGPERSGSENLLYGSSANIPNDMIMFGGPFTVTIISDPTAPVANPDSLSTPEDTALTLVDADLLANDTFTAGRTISVTSISTISGETTGTLSGNVYTPAANATGTDVLSYTIQDSTGLSATGRITISISPVNDKPDAIDDSFTIDEASTGNPLNVLANDNGGPNEAGDTLTITAVGPTSNGGTVTIAGGGGSLIYTPASSFVGTETFTYTITDQGGLTDTATVTVSVEATVIPRAIGDSITVAEDSSNNTIDVLANDRVNTGEQALLLSLGTTPANGTVSIDDNGTAGDQSDDTLVYTPNANFYGTDTFTYVMNDTSGTGANSTGTVTVTVTDVNDPVIVADDSTTATEDTPKTIAISTLTANDSPGAGEDGKQTLSISSVSAVGAGGAVAISGNNVIYTPAADFNGTFLFTYTAVDNGTPVSSGTATVTVTVAAVNDAPVAVADSVSGTEDTTTTIATSVLLGNDSVGAANETGQTLSVTGVSSTSSNGGTVSLSGSNISYAPALNFNGPDTFTYSISDGAGGTATGTVTVNVAAVNDAPIAGADSATAFKGIPVTISVADLLSNDSAGPSNESDQTLSIVGVTAGANTNGQVVLNNDGTITYTPAADFVGTATFQYQLQDSGATGGANVNTSSGTVSVTVEEFQPSVVSGVVWVDETQDGEISPRERFMGGVEVTLSGSSLGQTVAAQTILTLADGSYSFEGLGPGTYDVSFNVPAYMIDSPLPNHTTITIAEPGGLDIEQNFAVVGLSASYGRIMDQLASRYYLADQTLLYRGAYFAVGSDNSLLWGLNLDGYTDALFSEAVIDGNELLLTVVNSDHSVQTARLSHGEFLVVQASNGSALIRVLGSKSDYDWQSVNLQAPPVSVAGYLDSVDEIFGQEGWSSL